MKKNQIVSNIAMNIISFIIGVVISFFLTPYIVRTLGVEVYGFFPMANYIISYMMVISVALNTMAGRFISIAYHKGDLKKAQSYFNTTLITNSVIAMVMFILSIAIVLFLEKLINIPDYLIRDVKLLFISVFFASFFLIGLSAFNTSTIVKNRIDINAYISIFKVVLRSIILLLLFGLFVPNIAFIGIATVGVFVFEAICYIYAKKKILPEIKIGIKYFDKENLFTLLKAGFWNLCKSINTILILGLDLLFANIFLGVVAAGIIGITKTIPTYFETITLLISASFMPGFAKRYAVDKDGVFDELKKSFIPFYLFGALVLGGVAAVGENFYALWLPTEDSRQLYILTLLALSHYATHFGYFCVESVMIVKNKIKIPAIFSFCVAVFTVISVLIIINFTDIGLYAIAGVSSVTAILSYLLFFNWYYAKQLGQKWYVFYLYSLKGLVCIGAVVVVGAVVKSFIEINSWMTLFLVIIILAIISTIVIFFIVSNVSQRKTIYLSIKSKITKS